MANTFSDMPSSLSLLSTSCIKTEAVVDLGNHDTEMKNEDLSESCGFLGSDSNMTLPVISAVKSEFAHTIADHSLSPETDIAGATETEGRGGGTAGGEQKTDVHLTCLGDNEVDMLKTVERKDLVEAKYDTAILTFAMEMNMTEVLNKTPPEVASSQTGVMETITQGETDDAEERSDSDVDQDRSRAQFSLSSNAEYRPSNDKDVPAQTTFGQDDGGSQPVRIQKATESSSGKQSYICGVCEKAFPAKTHLTVHMRTHTGERPFQCDLCDKSFAISRTLRTHRNTHTGWLPFKCKECGDRFETESLLSQHYDLKHPRMSRTCCVCDQEFNSKMELSVHKYRVHGMSDRTAEKYDRTIRKNNREEGSSEKTVDIERMLANWPAKRNRTIVTRSQKKQIYLYKKENPGASYYFLSKHFSEVFGKRIGKSTIFDILKIDWGSESEDNSDFQEQFPCSESSKVYDYTSDRSGNESARRSHNEEMQTEKVMFSCVECEKVFSDKTSLRYHRRTHRKSQKADPLPKTGETSLVKRGHNTVTPIEKKQICQYKLENPKASTKFLSEHFGEILGHPIGKSTIGDILTNKDKWLAVADDASSFSPARHARHRDLEEALYLWYSDMVSARALIKDDELTAKAKELGSKLGIEDFAYSRGWLSRFKLRHSIPKLAFRVDATVTAVSGAVEEWEEMKSVLRDYNPEDIFNLDETKLYYRLEPNYTLESKSKRSEERVLVALCANATGSVKMKLFVISSENKPPSFGKDFNPEIYVRYRYSPMAWMTTEMFCDWLLWFDAQMKSSERKVILLLDSARTHSSSGMNLRNVTLHFLPPNASSYIQPMDAGITHAFKAYYKKALTCHYMKCIESGQAQHITLRRALRFMKIAWDEVSASTIRSCFSHASIMSCTEASTLDDCNTALFELQVVLSQFPLSGQEQVTSAEAYVDEEETNCALSDGDILQIVQSGGVEESPEMEASDSDQVLSPTADDAKDSLETLVTYFECTGDVANLNTVLTMLNSFK